MKNTPLKKVLLIARLHFALIMKAKAFWLGVLMTPALGVAMIMITRFAENSQPTRHFVVIDASGQYRQAIGESVAKSYIQKALKDYRAYFSKYKASNDSNGSPAEQLKSIADLETLVENNRPLLQANAPAYTLPKQRYALIATPADLNPDRSAADLAYMVRHYLVGDKAAQPVSKSDKIDAIAIIETGDSTPRVQYWSTNLNNSELSNLIENAVNQRLRQQLLLSGGIDLSELTRIENTKAVLSQFDAKKQKGEEGRTLADRISVAVPLFFALALFMILMISVSILLQGIIEEKSNRLIEVLLSSVTPTQLMAGKLTGVAAVSLVSIATWLALAIAGAYFGFGLSGAVASGGDQTAAAYVSPEQITAVLAAIGTAVRLLPVFIVCFICGYLIYASLFLAIGSLCASPRDANTLVTPLMVLMMVPMFLIRFFISDPNGPVATVFTWIPLYTPFAIVARMSAEPPLPEMIGSTVIMLGMTAVSLWISARIFRFGVLYSGETPRLFQVFRLVFANKNAT